MTANQQVFRLTQDAYDFLRELASTQPDLWFNPGTDFDTVLASSGIDPYLQSMDLELQKPIELSVKLQGGRRPNQADDQALSFHQALSGLSPANATDPLLWSWLAHFRLHAYSIERWPLRGADATRHIRQHYFLTDNSLGLFQMNVASRTWWLAQTALKAAEGSNGALSANQVVRYFADHAQHYHTIVMRESLRNSTVLAEFVRALLNGAAGINNEGVKALWRRL